MSFNSLNIGIYGYGTVGKAQAASLKNCNFYIKDPLYKKKSSDISNSDIVFICVPVPGIGKKDKHQDLTNVYESLDNIIEECNHLDRSYPIVVIRSSIHPDEIDKVINKYDRLDILYIPEFLNEISSFKDENNDRDLIIGGDPIVANAFWEKIRNYYVVPKNITLTSAKEACEVKFTHNLYSISKVLFWEMIQDLTGNARKIYSLYKLHEIKSDMNIIGMDGYRGAGGKCFPENLNALDDSHILIKTFKEYNAKLLGEKK